MSLLHPVRTHQRRQAEEVLAHLDHYLTADLLQGRADLLLKDAKRRRGVLDAQEAAQVVASILEGLQDERPLGFGWRTAAGIRAANEQHGLTAVRDANAQELVRSLGTMWVEDEVKGCCTEVTEVVRTLLLDGWEGSVGEVDETARALVHEGPCPGAR